MYSKNLEDRFEEINSLNQEECEERLVYFRYLLRREDSADKVDAYKIFIRLLEGRINSLAKKEVRQVVMEDRFGRRSYI